ncbi:MAG: Asd/ArgC dimerization domain-containing protein [Myxococcota bacterium]|nr:Asd/ArgC dimerization domain-containing protein [Myxococcota bacterium]
MTPPGLRVAVLGATGLVGEELLQILGEREFPVGELRCFGSSGDAGGFAAPAEIEFRGSEVAAEPADSARIADSDLVFCAAPGALDALLPAIRERGAALVDLSGSLELDPETPLWPLTGEPQGRSIAIPRGIEAGLGLALRPLVELSPLERLTVVSLESASGCGRQGVAELSKQTLTLLGEMTGEPGEARVFSEPLAFDCVPEVGSLLEAGETSSERRMRLVLRRLLGAPGLPIESTRVRVPAFSGVLACVHADFCDALSPARARDLWAKAAGIESLPEDVLPTLRRVTGTDQAWVGRVRANPDRSTGLAFVVALDNLRRGAALAAVEAAEALCGSD